MNEHLGVKGHIEHLREDLIQEDRKPNRMGVQAGSLRRGRGAAALRRAFGCNEAAPLDPGWPETLAAGESLGHLPPVARAFVYFGYRYVLRLGFLELLAGLSFHSLQRLWLQVLIDLRYLELRGSHGGDGQ